MKRAIALSGGGTKGSYELGVWRALNELGIDYQIVTGTSIGSINGALMATKDYDRAYELWNTITMEDMMEDGINLTTTIEGMYNQKDAIRPFLKKYVQNKGADISPFTEFIEKLIEEEKIRESEVDFGLVTVQFPSLKACELTKKDIPLGMMQDYIIASAAIFPLFPMHKIEDTLYLDGCYHDNLPINLALRMGAEEVIAVDLHTVPDQPVYAERPYVTYIKPSRSLGTMMNFDHELLMKNAEMGYQDTMRIYGAFCGDAYTFRKADLESCQESVESFICHIRNLDLYLVDDFKPKKVVKSGEFNRVHLLLSDKVKGGRTTKLDYFTAAAEICAEIFGLDKSPVYSVRELSHILIEKVLDKGKAAYAKELIEKDGMELASVLAEMKWKKKKQDVTSGIYWAYREKKIRKKAWIVLQTVFPEELAAALFLITAKK